MSTISEHARLPPMRTAASDTVADMTIRILPYTPRFVDPVRAFNRRLETQAAGLCRQWGRQLHVGLRLPERHECQWLPERSGRKVFEKYWLAVEGDEVRGGYIIKQQPFLMRGSLQDVAHFRLPISEGIVDRKYAALGPMLVSDVVRRYPFVFSFGLGGADQPMTKMLNLFRWSLAPVPLFVRTVRPFRFLRGMRYLRSSQLRRCCLDAAAVTGLGPLLIRWLQRPQRSQADRQASCDVVLAEEFGPDEDRLWNDCAGAYEMIGLRTQETLNTLYPVSAEVFQRLRVYQAGRYLGWVVVLVHQTQEDPVYGDLRLGLVVDHLSRPDDAPRLLACATRHLAGQEVDVITSHQSHQKWAEALRGLGFRQAPSHHLAAFSPPLFRSIGPAAEMLQTGMLTKGDGDGPTNLIQLRRPRS